jgi:cysteine synthase A
MSASVEVAPDVVSATSLPRLIQVDRDLVAAAFDVMKILPAAYIIDEAIRSGQIRPRTLVLETTSGTFGLGLAMVCALRGLKLHLVSDPVIEGYVQRRLVHLGAEVTVVHEPAAHGGYQAARLTVVEQIRRSRRDVFVPSQYTNINNPLAYAAVAEQIAQQVGEPSWLVGPVGSGGSMCGTASALRRVFPDLQIAGVDTHRSTLFGQKDGHRLLRGLGNSLVPPNLDHTAFDEVHWLSAELAFASTRELHRSAAVFAGPTSGAAYLVARHLATRGQGTVVVMLPDSGHRYTDTVFDEAWLSEHCPSSLDPILVESPTWTRRPPDVGTGWQAIAWQRRSLESVVLHASTGKEYET